MTVSDEDGEGDFETAGEDDFSKLLKGVASEDGGIEDGDDSTGVLSAVLEVVGEDERIPLLEGVMLSEDSGVGWGDDVVETVADDDRAALLDTMIVSEVVVAGREEVVGTVCDDVVSDSEAEVETEDSVKEVPSVAPG